MNLDELQDATTRELNPFAFAPHLASRIIGLGGLEGAPDSDYVFHTEYVACEPGRIVFKAVFGNLRATMGTIVFRINAAGTAEGISARTVKSVTRSLRDLSYLDGEQFIEIEATGSSLYAVLGHIHGQSDASADVLTITVRPFDPATSPETAQQALRSAFGEHSLRTTSRLQTIHLPTLREPVSQPATRSQLREAAFADAMRAIGSVNGGPAERWEAAYVWTSLRRYGLLQPGAAGIGIGLQEFALASACAAAGCHVTPTALPGTTVADGASGSLAQLDPADLPRSLNRCDFCWSVGTLDRYESTEDKTRFLTDVLRPLKIGGIAVHTFSFGNDPRALDRNTLERIVLDLISLGHEVAQVSYDDAPELLMRQDMPAVTPFGLILRKGRPPS